MLSWLMGHPGLAPESDKQSSLEVRSRWDSMPPLPLKCADFLEEVAEPEEGRDLAVVKLVHFLPPLHHQKASFPSPPPTRLPSPKHPVTSQIRTILEAVFASLTFQNSIEEAKDS